jgi:HPt (histidine-containing phosphotransfer) domain-containing protein
MSAVATFLAILEQRRNDYRAALPDRVVEIEGLWHSIRRSEMPAASLVELERKAHNLAGSGGTFNFPRLSEAARCLEKAVQSLRAHGNPPGPEEEQLLSRVIENLYDTWLPTSLAATP